jgi:hypothetical protein
VFATPAVGSGDTGVGVNQMPPVGETNNWHTATAVRFNSATGRIDARSGSTYQAATVVPFSGGSSYRVRMVINVATRTWAAYVTPPGGTEQTLGTNLAFRSNYASATFLNNVRGTVDTGSVSLCSLRSCGTSTPTGIYNKAIPAQTGTFQLTAEVTPAAGSTDTGLGLNQNPPVGETNNWHTAATVRFNSATGRVDARNGANYQAATVVPFTAGSTYRVRLAVNVPAHTYSAYVTPPGGTEQVLGTNLAFRSNYASATSFNNVRGTIDSGAVAVCNVAVGP